MYRCQMNYFSFAELMITVQITHSRKKSIEMLKILLLISFIYILLLPLSRFRPQSRDKPFVTNLHRPETI